MYSGSREKDHSLTFEIDGPFKNTLHEVALAAFWNEITSVLIVESQAGTLF